MDVFGELLRAQLENLASDPSSTVTGRLFYHSGELRVKFYKAAAFISILANDDKCIFGTNGTAANNVRFHRAGAGQLDLMLGNDTTAEGSATPANWAKFNAKLGGSKIDTYLDFVEVASPANPSAGSRRVFVKSDGLMYVRDSAGAETVVSSPTVSAFMATVLDDANAAAARTTLGAAASFTSSQILLDSPNGHGSTNTKIRRWTNSTTTGTDLTYADSATLGMTVTCNTAGLYSISYTDFDAGSTGELGISLNSSQLTTNVQSITTADRILSATATIARRTCVSAVVRLAVNDIIRAHTDGAFTGTAANQQFRIVRIG